MKVLLDTSPLTELARSRGDAEAEVINRLKLSALLADGFWVHRAILIELQQFLRVARGLSATLPGIKDLQTALQSHLVSVLPSESTDEVLAEEQAVFEQVSRVRAHHPMRAFIDAKLLVASQRVGSPIYTLDRTLSHFGAVMPDRWFAPCPFDVSLLSKVSFGEVFEISAPIRAIYRETFESFRRVSEEAARAVAGQQEEAARREELRHELAAEQSDLKSLKQKVLDVSQSEAFWREAARPKLNSALILSAVDLGLGLLPIPVPASIVVYWFQRREYDRQLREHRVES